ncbi:DUF190 domain-containing protein [bacterium]|nr:DUF190 domain-containing protein [bacterium]
MTEATMLRIYVGEGDRVDSRPVYEAIVNRAKELGLSGATVLRGVMGYGALGRVHTAKILRLSEDMPMIVEIVDESEQIDAFLPELDALVPEGLVTMEKVKIKYFRKDG